MLSYKKKKNKDPITKILIRHTLNRTVNVSNIYVTRMKIME